MPEALRITVTLPFPQEMFSVYVLPGTETAIKRVNPSVRARLDLRQDGGVVGTVCVYDETIIQDIRRGGGPYEGNAFAYNVNPYGQTDWESGQHDHRVAASIVDVDINELPAKR